MADNTAIALMKFFSTEERPMTSTEFLVVWRDLSDEEKNEWRAADLQA
jgi:hypothetical protein